MVESAGDEGAVACVDGELLGDDGGVASLEPGADLDVHGRLLRGAARLRREEPREVPVGRRQRQNLGVIGLEGPDPIGVERRRQVPPSGVPHRWIRSPALRVEFKLSLDPSDVALHHQARRRDPAGYLQAIGVQTGVGSEVLVDARDWDPHLRLSVDEVHRIHDLRGGMDRWGTHFPSSR